MKKLCIIDDDAIIRKGLSEAVPWHDFGYRVAACYTDGEQAVEGIGQGVIPDVAIVDIKMPFMDGIAFTEHARKAWPSMDIVILSGFDDYIYLRTLFRLGIKDYVLKPVNHNELIMAVTGGTEARTEKKESMGTVEKALDLLYNNYADSNLSLENAASRIGLTPEYFSSFFKKKVGSSFISVLTKIRLEKAKNLLAGSEMSAAEIAAAVGYAHPHYFSTRFKKETGMTPLTYRKSINSP